MFYSAPVFNGNVKQWDVAKVITMFRSKSISIVKSRSIRIGFRRGIGVGGYDVM